MSVLEPNAGAPRRVQLSKWVQMKNGALGDQNGLKELKLGLKRAH